MPEIQSDCFCPRCLGESRALLPARCVACSKPLLAKFDSAGNVTAEYRSAVCCGGGCKDCEYSDAHAHSANRA
jgi:hypothetical protein